MSSVLSHVTTLTNLVHNLVAAAAQRALLAVHDAHVSTGMRLATVASLAACLAVQLPYAWWACSSAGSKQLPGVWGGSRQQSPGLRGSLSYRLPGTSAGGSAWAWGSSAGSCLGGQQPGGELGAWVAGHAVGLASAMGSLAAAVARGVVSELAAVAGYRGPVSAVTAAVCRAVVAGAVAQERRELAAPTLLSAQDASILWYNAKPPTRQHVRGRVTARSLAIPVPGPYPLSLYPLSLRPTGRLIAASLLLLATLLVTTYVRSRRSRSVTPQPPGTTAPTTSSALSTLLSSSALGCMLPGAKQCTGAVQQQGAFPCTCQEAAVKPLCATSAHTHTATVAQRGTHYGQQQHRIPAIPVLDMLLLSARALLAHAPSTLAALALARGHPTAWLLLQLAWHVGLPYATVALCTEPGSCATNLEPRAHGCSAGALLSPQPLAFDGTSYQLQTRADVHGGNRMPAPVQGPAGAAGPPGKQERRSRWWLLAAAAWVYLVPLAVGFLPAVGAERLASWASRAAATVVVVGIAVAVVWGGAGSMLAGREEGRHAKGPEGVGPGPGEGRGGKVEQKLALEEDGRLRCGAYGSGCAPGVGALACARTVGAGAGGGGLGGAAGGVWGQGDGAVVVARVRDVERSAPTGKLDRHALW